MKHDRILPRRLSETAEYTHTNLVLGTLVLGEAIALTVPICKFRSLDLGERENPLEVNIEASTMI